ncbi:MAG TPA: XdhC family protein [Candidatus Binatia bacterium]|jgi:xanthine/CO dehydrogenase XdhC/CoxF family maturation factor|nr:XdhC family protein [Candidatus Binatia bacterium]
MHALLATVTAVRGSAYRRPGSRLLLTAAGDVVGTVSGGCLETDIARRGFWLTASGVPTMVSYDAGDEDDVGSGCGGTIDILLERLVPGGERHPLDLLAAVRETRRAGVVVTSLSGRIGAHCLRFPNGDVSCSTGAKDDVSLRRAAEHAVVSGPPEGTFTTIIDDLTLLVEVIMPPSALVVFGVGEDARILARFAKALDWDVTVTGSHAARTRRDRFRDADRVILTPADDPLRGVRLDARTAVVVMSHSLSLDREILGALRDRPLAYLGLLGPRTRTDRLLDDVAGGDATARARLRGRLYSPIGLDIGAEGPSEIALAIVAEVRAVLARRTGGHLRGRKAPLHQEDGSEPLIEVARHLSARGGR